MNQEFTTDLKDVDSKYFLNSHKDTPERSFPTPYPTLTDSQQIKLNNILHTGKLTNCNISTFSDYEFADSSFVEDVLDDSPVIEKGCCYLI